MTDEVVISPKIAAHALHWFDSDAGFSGGHVSDSLFAIYSHCDVATLDRLALGFPMEVAAFRLGRKPGGIAALRIIANKLSLVSE